jgi:hypothetical protein
MRKPNKHSADFSKHPWTQARASHQAPKFHTSRRLHLFRLAARISVDVELLWPANSRQGRCVDKSPSCPSSKQKRKPVDQKHVYPLVPCQTMDPQTVLGNLPLKVKAIVGLGSVSRARRPNEWLERRRSLKAHPLRARRELCASWVSGQAHANKYHVLENTNERVGFEEEPAHEISQPELHPRSQ